MKTFMGWLAGALGRSIDYDRAYGVQCVDLVNDYLVNGLVVAGAWGNAVDIKKQHIEGFRWVSNAPTNFPESGSIVVWNANVRQLGIGPYGHTAIVILADAAHMLTIDQNWDGAPSAQVHLHSYTGVAGWHALDGPAVF